MPKSINSAFKTFMKDKVNLPTGKPTKARASRDWLITSLNSFGVQENDFPELFTEKHMPFGSFARNTKKRPLDDIDLLLCMKANGVTYSDIGGTVYMISPETAAPFNKLLSDTTGYVSSIKVLNKVKSYLQNIPQYDQSDIKRDNQAMTMKLKTYDWNFDIVPCFYTAPEPDGREYYIMPDGNGNWMKTDPKRDQDYSTKINQDNNGNVLSMIRLVKYWNSRKCMLSAPSYLLENLVLNYYEHHVATEWPDVELPQVLGYISNAIYGRVVDQKGLSWDINTLNEEEQHSISQKALEHSHLGYTAREYEYSNTAYAFSLWQKILGSEFPDYEA
ncbi:hypothetical protein NB469_17965 [Vibrio alginolyticus]|uniref:hypothetical protein n=1 Tax=Vibrio alginolyticus TaxID=663 RepID=UPI00215BB4B8|nr:hypothetical protein [Vibrio alginolyticus]MCR9520279.1 hypothetical protein [Vibrio alginolyticus]